MPPNKQKVYRNIFSHEVCRMVVENAPESITVLARDGTIIAVNGVFQKMTGWKKSEALGRHYLSFLHPDSHSSARRNFNLVSNGKQVGLTEDKMITKRGEYLPVESAIVPIKKGGRVTGMLAFTRDISRRRRLQQKISDYTKDLERKVGARTKQLRHEKAENEAVLKGLGEGIIVVDNKIKVTIINQAAAKMLMLKEGDFIGKHADKLPQLCDENGEPLAPELRPLEMAVGTGKSSATEPGGVALFQRRTDGSKFPVAIVTTPVRLGRKTIGAVSVFRDITLGRELYKAKREFVSLASHQLRTPLSISSWYLEKVLEGATFPEGSKEASYLRTIYQSNRRMADLVDALLHTSRIEMGTLVLEPELISCRQIIDDVEQALVPAMQQKNLRFNKYLEREDITVMADPKALSIVIENLLSNSCRYTPDGGAIDVSVKDGKYEVTLEVSDTGYGIPRDQQHRIFTKLFRADNIIDKDTSGTGLGLYIVKSIIEKSNGKITFNSEENKGTTFIISLPK